MFLPESGIFPNSRSKRLVRYEIMNPITEPKTAGGDSRAIATKINRPLQYNLIL